MKTQVKTKAFEIGTQVQWNWMGHKVKGIIQKIYLKPIEKTFRGTVFRRNGDPTKPAYLVKSVAGNEVLKSHTELTKVK